MPADDVTLEIQLEDSFLSVKNHAKVNFAVTDPSRDEGFWTIIAGAKFDLLADGFFSEVSLFREILNFRGTILTIRFVNQDAPGKDALIIINVALEDLRAINERAKDAQRKAGEKRATIPAYNQKYKALGSNDENIRPVPECSFTYENDNVTPTDNANNALNITFTLPTGTIVRFDS